MDNQRIFLGIALLFVLFLIWQTWIEEQSAKRAPPAAEVTAVPGTGAEAPAGAPAPPPAQDVPTVGAAAPAPTVDTSTGDRIRVITDQYEAEISTVGGDLRVLRLRQFPISVQQPDIPFTLLNDVPPDFFVAQSGLVSTGDSPAPNHHATYQAAQTEYRLAEGQSEIEVPLTWSEGGIQVTKTYRFARDSFVIGVNHAVQNASGQPWSGSQYRQLQRIPPVDDGNAQFVYTYTGGVISSPEKKYEKIKFEDMNDPPLERDIQGGWLAMIEHYFAVAWVPPAERLNRFYTRVVGGNRYVLGMTGPLEQIDDGAGGEFSSQMFVGPKIQDRLGALAPGLELTVDYGWLTIIAQPLFWLLKTIHGLVGNWGWSIILLTVLIKAVFFKLSETSYRSMANMRKLQPRMKSIREKFAHDKQKMNQAMMDLYKKEKINPMGGCLPIVVQIPVFIALYWMLLESVELRQAPFMLWIDDLSAKDPYFVLPILMGASMFIQQRLNPAPPDPIQAKVMMALPLVFTIFFLWFPSGLVVYWLVNNILSIAQQYVITKRVEAGTD
jgi:YidC/Oxa1 family membrane protein insertase